MSELYWTPQSQLEEAVFLDPLIFKLIQDFTAVFPYSLSYEPVLWLCVYLTSWSGSSLIEELNSQLPLYSYNIQQSLGFEEREYNLKIHCFLLFRLTSILKILLILGIYIIYSLSVLLNNKWLKIQLVSVSTGLSAYNKSLEVDNKAKKLYLFFRILTRTTSLSLTIPDLPSIWLWLVPQATGIASYQLNSEVRALWLSFMYLMYTQSLQKIRYHNLTPNIFVLCLLMWESWVWSLGGEDPLEEGMAMHSSILAWRIPWTEGAGGL